MVDKNTKKKDTLYKIRPLLGIIEANLGKYLTPCTELSLDETCVAIRSQWARAMTNIIQINPKESITLNSILYVRTVIGVH